jgi:3-oxoacyl-[acyl-carrier protein] reductase
MQIDLSGQVALVTGAARGIGLAVAEALGGSGAAVALCDLDPAADEALARVPGEALYLPCDVTDAAAVEAAVKSVVQRLGGLQILVNNAGIADDALLLRTRPEQWQRVLSVNLTGAFNCSRAAARQILRARQRGRIVNISSVVGERGNAGQVAYAASKAGLLGVTRALARELAPRGVTVNAVSPGYIETRMTRRHVSAEQREKLLTSIPLGRIGNPEEVAQAVLFLCSPEAGYITGQVLRVNGGMYI